ncbi:TAP-like protein-domain-containing protein [Achaetomium macrosporum]|uniref:TAP-like protein-domain-containing protein n=1 Tax=Achaetomium macrosporum TaxID=79813 RepID=A0AAN7HAK6_9PEZI|nr:TAP-like protein-domain-containing protein [Achaetomium macrosporum]
MRSPTSSWTLWSATLLLSSPASAINFLRSRQLGNNSFDWTSITPTPDLQYHPCYDGTFQCARLQLPLDYSKAGPPGKPYLTNNTQQQQHAAIAIVTLPATVPPTDPSYAGPVLINPGGPSGSGTSMALAAGTTIRNLLDVPGERHYDIVGFDPRGVAFSTPSASCYATEFDRAVNALQEQGLPSVVTEQGLWVHFEASRALGALCEETTGGDGVFRHMSTASVARDMLEIVERMYELQKGVNGMGKRSAGEKPRLQYLGFSYGTYLGNTFASMFPDRVGRMVVDGVVDGDDYTAGAGQKNVNDAEAEIDIFYNICFDAGDACPLRDSQDTSAADIRARVTALLQTLRETPVAAVYNGRVYIVSSYLISETIRQALYTPIPSFAPLAQALAESLAGNFTRVLSNPGVMLSNQRSDVCTEPPVTSPPQQYTFSSEVTSGVVCGDSQASAGTRDFAWATSAVPALLNQSVTVGEAWARIPLACADWPFTPPYAFRGPFGSAAPPVTNTTASSAGRAPLLILSSRTDPATPLDNAFALSRLHGGSAVVVQESAGHTALFSSVSNCTLGIVREYFASGKVPANGTVCEAECAPGIPYQECPGLPQFY